ncbi:hypothetical protein L5515_003356 [Caenorhabditis briggsae]|uniref:Uncharacterized protein n=3 Tax=Caenorhabditis briggsae TaxID=6238 RepID=A0AAE9EH10_CAEBR|nr:hypothetical protein L5515_003356 [Caenorhabditis briggsae]
MYSKQMGPLEELDTLMTIKIEQFEEMLTAFNVDKRQITEHLLSHNFGKWPNIESQNLPNFQKINSKTAQKIGKTEEKWFEKYLKKPKNPEISIEMKDLKTGKSKMLANGPKLKHTDTNCGLFNYERMILDDKAPNILLHWTLTTKTTPRIVLRPSYRYIFPNEISKGKCKYFLTDQSDEALINQWIQKNDGEVPTQLITERMKNLTMFEKHGKQNFYIRCIPPADALSQEDGRIFVEDAVEIVPLIAKKSSSSMNKKLADKKLNNHKMKWIKGQIPQAHSTISVADFVDFLGELDCNKSLVTIVEDAPHLSTKNEMVEGFGYIRTCTPYAEPAMDHIQAIFFTFHCLVNGVNWTKEDCLDHKTCLPRLKKAIFALLKKWAGLNKGSYIEVSYVVEQVEEIRRMCPYKYLTPRNSPDYAYQDYGGSEYFDTTNYFKALDYYGLTPFEDMPEGGGRPTCMLIGMQRFLMQIHWIKSFFTEKSDRELRELVGQSALHLLNEDIQKDALKYLNGCTTYTKSKIDDLMNLRPPATIPGSSAPMVPPGLSKEAKSDEEIKEEEEENEKIKDEQSAKKPTKMGNLNNCKSCAGYRERAALLRASAKEMKNKAEETAKEWEHYTEYKKEYDRKQDIIRDLEEKIKERNGDKDAGPLRTQEEVEAENLRLEENLENANLRNEDLMDRWSEVSMKVQEARKANVLLKEKVEKLKEMVMKRSLAKNPSRLQGSHKNGAKPAAAEVDDPKI